MNNQLHKISNVIGEYSAQMAAKSEDSEESENCHLLARILDRLFMIAFLVVNIGTYVYLMHTAPTRSSSFSFCPLGKGNCPEDFDYASCDASLEAGWGCTA